MYKTGQLVLISPGAYCDCGQPGSPAHADTVMAVREVATVSNEWTDETGRKLVRVKVEGRKWESSFYPARVQRLYTAEEIGEFLGLT